MIHQVSSLNEVIVPGRVHHSFHVHRNSPLRVFASTRNRIVFGGCSPVKRLSGFTKRCTRILRGGNNLPVTVVSGSRIVTTSNVDGERILRHQVAGGLRRLVRGESIRVAAHSIPPVGTVRKLRHGTGIICPVICNNSISKTITLVRNSRGRVPARARVGLIRITTTFLNGRVR